MFKLKMLGAAVLVAATVISAADAEKKADEKKITPYGHAQYRLRSESVKKGDADFKTSYYNKIAYHLGVKASVGTKFTAVLQVGNKSIATESVNWNPISEDVTPFFHLAYAKWDPGFLNISAGIIPMKSNGALDLLERSIYNGGNIDKGKSMNAFSDVTYAGASQVGWAIYTENSIMGLQLGVPILKDDIKLSVDAAATVIEEKKDTPSQTKILWIFNVPFKVSVLSFTPQISLLQNRIVNTTTNKKDHEFAAGANIGVKATKDISFGLALGLSKIDDESTKAENADTQERKGKYLSVSTKIKAGPGNIQAAYKLSSDATEEDDSSIRFHYIDLKYGIAAHKNFTIMPRIRFFMNRWANEAVADLEKTTKIRPELIFIGKF